MPSYVKTTKHSNHKQLQGSVPLAPLQKQFILTINSHCTHRSTLRISFSPFHTRDTSRAPGSDPNDCFRKKFVWVWDDSLPPKRNSPQARRCGKIMKNILKSKSQLAVSKEDLNQ
ncbi:hypothetical protein CLIB1423_25S01398 [[Candida] railenensis]|uniref:Uncharacterized protein n=1 Tax=[Candida] railenensis TaxID=45579 RepID=A0A9P0QVH6_9ASCO|nr:hypothetical protein CLIB1423_25S01398 [[Candida] railenensis]